jgi:hypothetical protein
MTNQLTLSVNTTILSTKKKAKKRYRYKYPELSDYERNQVADHMLGFVKNLEYNIYQRGRKNPALALALESERFRGCGDKVRVWECRCDNQKFTTPISCNSRICERCQRRYSAQLKKTMIDVLKPFFLKKRRGWFFSFLTLTVQKDRYGDNLPDREDIKRFNRESRDFLKLYYGKYAAKFSGSGKVVEIQKNKKRKWRGAGGIAVIELGAKNNNLHLHALVYGPYISQKKLSESWCRITGDSFVVGIEAVKSPENAVFHVLKYISKPPARESYRDLAEYSMSIKGSRRFRCVGVFYNKIKRIRETLNFVCPYCGGQLAQYEDPDGGKVETTGFASLYPLLHRLKDSRGSPGGSKTLPLPPGYETNRERSSRLFSMRYCELLNGGTDPFSKK